MRAAPHRTRQALGAALAAVLCVVAAGTIESARGAARAAADPPTVYVTSTADGPPTPCKPGRHCSLRDAIETVAQTGRPGRIAARFCGTGVPGPYCLGQDDPNYVPAARVWRIPLIEPYGFDITGTQVTIDFSVGVADWQAAADNVIELDTGQGEIDWAFGIDGTGHVLRGLNLRGDVQTAQVVLYNGATGVTLDGLAFAGVGNVGEVGGDAIRVRDEKTTGNRIIGTQCGWFGPPNTDGAARPPEPVSGTCVEVSRGAHDNQIGELGGPPNVFADAAIGVHVTGRGTRGNEVRNARVDGNGVGIRVSADALETRLEGNTIVRSSGNGVEVVGASWSTAIVGNRIGIDAGDVPAESPLPNEGWGIDIAAPAKGSRIEDNLVQGNGAGGIRVAGRTAEQNALLRNRITDHVGAAIAVVNGANGGVAPPALSWAGARIVGRTCSQCDVQLFSDPADEAAALEGAAKADNGGTVIFTPGPAFRFRFITALATDPDGNSSALSAPLDTVPGPTPTATSVGPVVRGRLWLPVAWRGWPR